MEIESMLKFISGQLLIIIFGIGIIMAKIKD